MAARNNRAAWLVAKQAAPLQVKPAPFPSLPLAPDDVLIKVVYTAMNPADWKIIKRGQRVTVFPNVLGQDASGVVEEVGKSVTHVKKGSRVVAHLMAVLTQNPAEGAFQHYALAKGVATASLQDGVSLLDASVLPLALSTATVALYTPKQLSLELPSPTLSSKAKDEYVLVWGGSSSVGSIAIQLLRFSGYMVATTCSPRNTEYVKELGAELVFDHSSATVVKDITTALDARPLIGAFNAVGDEKSSIACVAIVHANQSPTNKKHVATTGPVPVDVFEGVKVVPLGSAATMFFDEDRKEIARYIWQDFLSIALTKGFRPAPEPLVVGNGLESVQKALDTLEAGVSARKVVVKVQEE